MQDTQPYSEGFSKALLPVAKQAEKILRATVQKNRYIPDLGGRFPSLPQTAFLTLPYQEILFGGAAGGGKSAGILAAALQYVDYPGYNALIVRRSYADLEKPGALIPLSKEWLIGSDAKYNEQSHRWTFPSGSTLSFGFIQTETSVQQDYQGSAYAFIGFDELTQFSEFMYRYLFSRLRISDTLPFPTRMRATSNPGGTGHEWVKARFIDGQNQQRLFIPARLEDNPGLNKEDYERSLAQLDPVTRAQLRHGDWNIRPEGNLFKRAWFKTVQTTPTNAIRRVRHWDLAATEAAKGKDPDFTAGAKLALCADSNVCIEDIVKTQSSARDVERIIRQTAELDGKSVAIQIEEEPGSSGKALVDHYIRDVLPGWNVRGVKASGDKVTRSLPFSAACERGLVTLLRGAWVLPFLDELTAFPIVAHDDQVDAVTGSFSGLHNAASYATLDASIFAST